MPDNQQPQFTQLNDAISGDRAEQFANDLQHQKSRAVIKEVLDEYSASAGYADRVKIIVVDHTDTVPFMKKVQGYADEQIDKRLFKNAKVVLGLVVGWAASICIAVAIAKLT